MFSESAHNLEYDGTEVIVITKWKVRVGSPIGQRGTHLFAYRRCDYNLQPIGDEMRFKTNIFGIIVDRLLRRDGDLVVPGEVLMSYAHCSHNTIMKELCADCGANINTLDVNARQRIAQITNVSMVHSVPELRVSIEQAESLGRADEQRLLKDRKLVLLVDLDQTIIHSTNQDIPADMKGVHHFQLYGANTQWYHTKFRPNTIEFLKTMSKKFELHICSFGVRRYAHEIASLLDSKEQFFPKDRILSRDECFDATSKTGNMKSLFPCGDSMVCIIDDREDVWNFAPNLVTVKPYIYFRDTGDINAPEKRSLPILPNPIKHYETKIESKSDDSIDNTISANYSQTDANLTQLNEIIASGSEIKSETKESVNEEKIEYSSIKKDDNNDNIVEPKVDYNELKEPTEDIKSIEVVDTKHESECDVSEKHGDDDNKDDSPEINLDSDTIKIDSEDNDVKNTSDDNEVKDNSDDNEVKNTSDDNEVKDNSDDKEVKNTSDDKEVKNTSDDNEVKNTSDDNEVKNTSDDNEVKNTSDDNEVKNTSDDNEVKNTSDDNEVKNNSDVNEVKDNSDDNDDYLLYLEEILMRIHTEYYKEYDEKMKYKTDDEQIKIPDLKEIIPRVRKCVLRGVNIVFSGIIPTNISVEKNKLYNTAKNFGATVTPDVIFDGSPKTTHLIAAKWGTMKVNKCVKARNVWIVNPLWLSCCAERWEKVDERLYLLEKDQDFSEKEKFLKPLPEMTIKNDFVNQPIAKKNATVCSLPVYDPITGKRIRQQSQDNDVFLENKPQGIEQNKKKSDKEENKMLEQSRQIQPHNMVDFSPLSQFTRNELQSMGKEVDDACSEGDAMSTGNTDSSDSDIDVEDIGDQNKTLKRKYETSSDESINDGEFPKGWSKKFKKLPKHVTLDENNETNDSTDSEFNKMHSMNEEDSTDASGNSIGSVDEEMAAAVEREFLS